MAKQSNRLGFTLLELLIVVIIVSILAAVALPRFGRMTRRARSSEASSAVGSFLTAELLYYQEHTLFTTVIGELLVDINLTNFTYAITTPGGAAVNVMVVATGAAPATTNPNIVVTGTLLNDGSRTAQTVTGI